jgi:tetratricopeptide (TPR) repeat protein
LNEAALVLQGVSPSQAKVPYTLGRIYLSRYLLLGQPSDLDRANRHFLEAAQRNPQEGLYLASMGQVELLAGQAQVAEPWFRQALGRDPSNQDYLYGLGETLEALGQSKEAAQVYRQGNRIKADPRFSGGLARLEKP